MLVQPGPADEAQMRQEFRRLYREVGLAGCTQVLFELLKSGEWLSQIMLEETGKEHGCGCNATAACARHSGRLPGGL